MQEEADRKEKADREIVQYLWDKLGGRTFDITTLAPGGMVSPLYDLLPDQGDEPLEEAVIAYLQEMARRENTEYQLLDGTRVRIVEAPRPDWPKGKLGFRVERK